MPEKIGFARRNNKLCQPGFFIPPKNEFQPPRPNYLRNIFSTIFSVFLVKFDQYYKIQSIMPVPAKNNPVSFASKTQQ